MRLAPLAALGLVLIAVPALVHADIIIAGSYTCSQRVPCEDNGSISSTQWAEYGNACISRGFGYTSTDGFIDDVAGLDSSNCLTTKKDFVSPGMNSRLFPQCCVIKTSNGTNCAVHCNLISQ